MAEHFLRSQQAFEEIHRLRSEVAELKEELSVLKQAGGDQGWMSIKKAAGIIGMTTNALSQRFRRGFYPEGVVWGMENGRYVVNLRALRDHMARGQH